MTTTPQGYKKCRCLWLISSTSHDFEEWEALVSLRGYSFVKTLTREDILLDSAQEKHPVWVNTTFCPIRSHFKFIQTQSSVTFSDTKRILVSHIQSNQQQPNYFHKVQWPPPLTSYPASRMCLLGHHELNLSNCKIKTWLKAEAELHFATNKQNNVYGRIVCAPKTDATL